MNNFLVGNILREVKNGRLNCNNKDNEMMKGNNTNGTYVKKIRVGKETFPYASSQWQKKNIKDFAEAMGFNISSVTAVSTKEAVSEGNPLINFDEDVLGFMIAKNDKITPAEYELLDKETKELWKKDGKVGYKKNVTVKRRSNLMLSTLQATGNTRLLEEFATRQTDKSSILYSKEVYATDMSSSFILDKNNVGVFKASSNEAAYRDYTINDVKEKAMVVDVDNKLYLDKKTKLDRISCALKALQLMPTRTTMTNNLEDMSAKFMIFADYSIGNSIFNNIFERNKLKLEYLAEAIDENEAYRLSKIYIGCRSEFFKQDGKYLKDLLIETFGADDRFVIGSVNDVIKVYSLGLEVDALDTKR